MLPQRVLTCGRGCGTRITFDDKHISKNTGKKIPLEYDTGLPHQCPNSDYNKQNKGQGSTSGNDMKRIIEWMDHYGPMIERILALQEGKTAQPTQQKQPQTNREGMLGYASAGEQQEPEPEPEPEI